MQSKILAMHSLRFLGIQNLLVMKVCIFIFCFERLREDTQPCDVLVCRDRGTETFLASNDTKVFSTTWPHSLLFIIPVDVAGHLVREPEVFHSSYMCPMCHCTGFVQRYVLIVARALLGSICRMTSLNHWHSRKSKVLDEHGGRNEQSGTHEQLLQFQGIRRSSGGSGDKSRIMKTFQKWVKILIWSEREDKGVKHDLVWGSVYVFSHECHLTLPISFDFTPLGEIWMFSCHLLVLILQPHFFFFFLNLNLTFPFWMALWHPPLVSIILTLADTLMAVANGHLRRIWRGGGQSIRRRMPDQSYSKCLGLGTARTISSNSSWFERYCGQEPCRKKLKTILSFTFQGKVVHLEVGAPLSCWKLVGAEYVASGWHRLLHVCSTHDVWKERSN